MQDSLSQIGQEMYAGGAAGTAGPEPAEGESKDEAASNKSGSTAGASASQGKKKKNGEEKVEEGEVVE